MRKELDCSVVPDGMATCIAGLHFRCLWRGAAMHQPLGNRRQRKHIGLHGHAPCTRTCIAAAAGPGRRTLRDRKVSQRMAVVDDATRQQVKGLCGVRVGWDLLRVLAGLAVACSF